jgi:hypothetical protein
MQPINLLIIQDRPAALLNSRKPCRINLMLRNQVPRAEAAAQEIGGHRVAECNSLRGRFRAEDYHVGEIGTDLGCRFFAVEAAGWKDGFYGSDGQRGGVEGQVAGIVLYWLLVGLGWWQERGKEETYNGNDAVVLKKGVEAADELVCEEFDWLGAAGEDVVDDVVVLHRALGLGVVNEGARVFDDGGVVGWEAEVLAGELVHHRVDFDDGGVDAVADEGTGRGTNSEAAGGFLAHVSLLLRP